MTLIATDGYEYADLTQRLLGQPLKSPRNTKLTRLKEAQYPEAEIVAFFKAYDKACGQHPDKDKAAWFGLSTYRRKHGSPG